MITGLAACGSENRNTEGGALGIAAILPPVRDALPSQLSAGSAAGATRLQQIGLLAVPTGLTTIKDRFFKEGPTDFLYRLSMIDSRLAELSARHAEGARTCVGEEAKLWDLKNFPDGAGGYTGSFPMYFSCSEAISDTSWVYFGIKDGYSYIAEIQEGAGDSPMMTVLAKVNKEGTQTEVAQIVLAKATQHGGDDAKKRSSLMFVRADKTAKTFQLSVASTGNMGNAGNVGTVEPFTGVGCGARLNINESLVYGTGIFQDNDKASECNGSVEVVCASASDLSDKGAATECTAAGLNTFGDSLPFMTSGDTGITGAANMASIASGSSVERGYALGNAIVSRTDIPTVTDFNTTASAQ